MPACANCRPRHDNYGRKRKVGTDIHLIAEAKNEAGEWELVPGPIEDCWFCKGTGIIEREGHDNYKKEWLDENVGKPCRQCTNEFWEDEDGDGNVIQTPERSYVGPGKMRDEWYSSRNYSVFAYLADVRNGTGFAGVITGNPVVPIAQPRGFPDDLSDEAVSWFNHYGGDHTESWLLVDEVLDYDWESDQVHQGVVDEQQYQIWKAKGQPQNWSGDVSGGGVRNVSNAEMDVILTGRECGFKHCVNPDHSRREPGVSYFTVVKWTTPASGDCKHLIDRMKVLKFLTKDRECRIVFNFDS